MEPIRKPALTPEEQARVDKLTQDLNSLPLSEYQQRALLGQMIIDITWTGLPRRKARPKSPSLAAWVERYPVEALIRGLL